jgi:hypothetical protein
MAVVLLEGRLSPIPMRMASTKLSSWAPSRGMSIRAVERKDSQINQTQFVAESRIFSIVRHHAIEISPENNYKKITMAK